MEKILMVSKEEKRHLKYSDYFATVTLIGMIVLIVTIFSSVFYVKGISKQVTKNQHRIERILDDLSDKNSKITNKKDYNNENYSDFIKNYYEVQANSLNIWLTALALIMATLGIMIPICFVKFLENKEKEMDRIIQEAKEQKTKTKANVREMTRQLREVTEKSNKMTTELNEVKDYVATVQSESIYVNAVTNYNLKKYEKAIELLIEAKSIKNNDKISYLLGECYKRINKLRSAINAYDIAIAINPNIPIYYNCKASCLNSIGEYSSALREIEKSISLNKDDIYAKFQKLNILVSSNKETYRQSAKSFVDQNYEKYKNDAYILNAFGCLLILAGYHEKAEKILLHSRNIDKNPYIQYYNLTKIYISKGQYQDAKSTLKCYLMEDLKRENLGIYDNNYNEWYDKLTTSEQTMDVIDLLGIIKNIKITKRKGDDE